MLTRCFRIVAIAAFAFALPAVAHQVEIPAAVAGVATAVAGDIVLTGTVKQLVVEDRTTGTTTTYRTLRQDDGTALELTGTLAASLEVGARAQITGQQSGSKLAMTQVQSLAALPSVAVATTSSQVQGTLTLAHSDNFAAGHGEFSYVVRPQGGGRAVPLVLDLMPDTLKNGMQVLASGNVAAGAVSLDANYITIIAPAVPKRSAAQSLTPLALTTNNLLVILVKFSDSPTTDPFTQAQVDAVVRTNPNSVASYYNEVSYSKEQLNATVTPWLQTGVATPASCDYTTIGNLADTAATAAGYTGTYQNRFYVFPRESACGWAGLAYVSFGEAWSNGYNQLSVYAHELGHNFGLLHAGSLDCGSVTLPYPTTGCGASEYGDPFVVMGNQSAGHFDALQKTLIDAPSGPWIAAAGVKTHTSGTVTYTLGPIESAGVSTYAVKIPTTASNRTYWLEYRQPVGLFDTFISAANSGLHVRVASPFEVSSGADDTEIIDMTPGSASAFSNAALLPGLTYVDNQYNVTISVLSATPGAAGAMTVQVTTPGSGTSTTTAVASSANPSAFGASVTFTATVTGNSPTGTVGFTDNGSAISGCAAQAVSAGKATCATAALTVGSHSIVATYSGDAGNNTSTSPTLTQTVNKAASSTTLASSANPSTSGTSVTFTATVTGSAPTGTVGFTDNGSAISGCTAQAVSAGKATCATAALTVGSHSIVATYSGDAANAASASAPLAQVINASSSGAASFVGTDLTTQGNWKGVYGSDGYAVIGDSTHYPAYAAVTPTGNSTYVWAAQPDTDPRALQRAVVAGRIAATWFSSTSFTVDVNVTDGNPHRVALYNLDWDSTTRAQRVDILDGNSGSVLDSRTVTGFHGGQYFVWTVSGHVMIRITMTAGANAVLSGIFFDKAVTTTTTLSSSLNPAIVGASVTFTATITGSAPTGTVGFASDGSAISGCTAQAVSAGKATCATAALTVGSHSIVATYSGDGNNAGSTSPTLTQTVNKAASSTTLASSANPSTFGTSVTFTATVTGNSPTGTVGFTDNGSAISGCAAQAVSAGKATCATAALTVGSHSIVATYSGDAGNNTSTSPTLTQTVNKAASSTTLASSANPSTSGTSVTFTATVTGSAPTGTVGFTDNGSAISGCTAQAVSAGKATCATAALTVGSHSIVATYSGDAANAASASAPLAQVINASSSGAASFVGTDLTTQGNWKGVYGSDGYAVIGDSTHYPAYAAVTPTGNSTYVWAAQPDTDPRALQRAVVAGRIAATWFSSTSFTVDVNVTDGNPHRVALYNLDWDSTTRAQRVDILDGNSGSVLDSRTVTGFHGGQYFVWTVSGHVMIRITMTAGANAVLSGIFFK